jgi:hypothetical protein
MKPLSKDDSLLFCKFSKNKSEIIFEHNADIPRTAASITKVLYAAEILRRLNKGEISNEQIKIDNKSLAGYGTDVLSDLIEGKNQVYLDVETLVKLMIKYSCNSSTLILNRKYLQDFDDIERASKYWGVRSFDRKNNKLSVKDIFMLYKKIYTLDADWLNLLKASLKEARSIYRLFDLNKINLLGSKSGTLFQDGIYTIGDSGVFEFNNETYFLGAIFSDKSITSGISRMRNLGRKLINSKSTKNTISRV